MFAWSDHVMDLIRVPHLEETKKGAETNAYMLPTKELYTTQCWIPSLEETNKKRRGRSFFELIYKAILSWLK